MKKIIMILSVLVSILTTGCSAESDAADVFLTVDYFERGNYKLEITYPSEAIEFGSTAEIILTIEYPEDESYILLPPVLDNAERYSNTLITDVIENSRVIDISGRAVNRTVFRIEAWLPGELAFPPLTVLFKEELSTDEIVIPVRSEFDASDEDSHELAPLYMPDGNTGMPLWGKILLFVLAAGSAAAAVILLLQRKKKKNAVPIVKNRSELLDEFRKEFIESEGEIDLREAFTALRQIIDFNVDELQRSLINEIRFSKNSYDYNAGLALLHALYGGSNEL